MHHEPPRRGPQHGSQVSLGYRLDSLQEAQPCVATTQQRRHDLSLLYRCCYCYCCSCCYSTAATEKGPAAD